MDLYKLIDRPIAFQRSFVTLTGGICPALLLSQMIYWTKRASNRDGWFYKTAEDWSDETGMTRCELESSRKTLKRLGILEEKKQGIPCQLFFKINGGTIAHLLRASCFEESSEQACGKPANKIAGNQQTDTIYTETTSETSHKKEEILEIPPALDTPEFRQTWADYETHRRQKRVGKLTAIGVARKMKEMESWGVVGAIEAINASISNGWDGIFKPKTSLSSSMQNTASITDMENELESLQYEFVGHDAEAVNAKRLARRAELRTKIKAIRDANG